MRANKRQITVVLDDGGGYTMAVWANKYAADCMVSGGQVADMITAVKQGDDCGGWDNNEWANKNVMSHMDNQACRTYSGTPRQVRNDIIRDYRRDNVYGANHEELAKALLMC